jgi:hypothetical protein
MPDRDFLLLDACSLINLYATRRIAAILGSHPGRFGVVDTVRREAGYVFRGGDGPDATEREPIDLGPLEKMGLITTLAADSEDETLTYIDLTLEMDDGEAMTGAIAVHGGFTVVTDDRKALRVLSERGVTCETTLDLIKGWAERTNVPRNELRMALLNVRQRARYVPHRTHHLRAWWDEAMS